MPLNPISSPSPAAHRRRRTGRSLTVLVLAVGIVGILIMAVLGTGADTPDTADGDQALDLRVETSDDGRPGRGLHDVAGPAPSVPQVGPVDPGSIGTQDAAQDATSDTSSRPGPVAPNRLESSTVEPEPEPGSEPGSTAPTAGGGAGPASTPASGPTGPARPTPFYLPGTTQETPVVGQVRPVDHDSEARDVPGGTDPEPLDERDRNDPLIAVPEVERPPETVPTPQDYVEEAPDRDEIGCPNLQLYPIGGYEEGAPASFETLSPRIRELAPAELAKEDLVCGYPLEAWRDLVVQRLVTAGEPDGAFITAADGSSIVMRVSEIEWRTYRFRSGGGPEGPNLVGYPAGRFVWEGVDILRTTNGGLVFASAGTIGIPVLGGVWEYWESRGGPSSELGLPIGDPEAATGPTGADQWHAGLVPTGARQDFTNGWLFLPGVLSEVEAAVQPAEDLLWFPYADPDEEEPAEPDYRGSMVKLDGRSHYVDMEGVRHWISTRGGWMCATWDLGAATYEITAHQMAQIPAGDAFVCDDYK